jgi:nicotinic acid mononucleotide adenylyltransferase
MPEMDIASSEIRRRSAAGESIDGLVSPSVAVLIAAEGLYQSGGAG